MIYIAVSVHQVGPKKLGLLAEFINCRALIYDVEKAMAPTPALLPGKSHGRRSMVGCSPWGRKELDMTERLHFDFSLSCIGEGNGNPLQCSCLENPRDGGAWWAAVYGVTQSRTQLKWLSSNIWWRIDVFELWCWRRLLRVPWTARRSN